MRVVMVMHAMTVQVVTGSKVTSVLIVHKHTKIVNFVMMEILTIRSVVYVRLVIMFQVIMDIEENAHVCIKSCSLYQKTNKNRMSK